MKPFAHTSFALRSAFLYVSLATAGACSSGAPDDESGATGSGGNQSSGGASATGGSVFGSGGLGNGGSGGLGSGGLGSGGSAETGGAGTGGASDSGGASSGGAATGGEGSGGTLGTGGEGTGGMLTLIEPVERGADSYVLEFGNTFFEVDPTQGARIVSFSHAGTNLLRPTELVSAGEPFLNGGSTFWLSPQTAWDADPESDWPPPPVIDADPYAVTLVENAITAKSGTATIGMGAQFSVEKRFAADLAAEGIDITYTITNEGEMTASYAPWEVSRHGRGGLTFWPGAEVETGEFTLGAPQDGVIWWDDSSSSATGKVFSDGSEGWIAHVEGGVLLVKVWADHSALAPTHGEVELYLGDGYIEIEEHGPYGSIASSGSTPWNIRWYVRPLDASVDIAPGSAALLEMARALAD